ncbi:MAG: hypothetical protein QOF55_226, partial [Thermoleophilaceae bacterium]|nr:hypothetical protein [Thermoleophilaceae bacterium]
GEYDWQGFDPQTFDHKALTDVQHPTQIDPPRGFFTNWNNKQAPGWHAADDNWSFGSLQRVLRLQRRVQAGIAGAKKMNLTQLTQAMADAATVDLRGQESYPLLRRVLGSSPDASIAEPLKLLDAWAAKGGHRRDLDGDGVYEDSAAVALMDAWWEPLMRGIFQPALGEPLVNRIAEINPFSQTPGTENQGSSFFSGWHGYADKDLRALLGDKVTGPLSRRYCGGGALDACRAILTSTLAQAADKVRSEYGVASLGDVRIKSTGCAKDPICDEIRFSTAGAVDTPSIPWQDRPTFQQVVELGGPGSPSAGSGTAKPAPTATPKKKTMHRESGAAPQRRESAAGGTGSGVAGVQASSLPFTGFAVGGVAALALALVGTGLLLRRRTAA